MTDLERRALLGDTEAQRECTKKWIVLACPFCGDGSAVSFIETDEQPYANHIQGFVLCRSCGFSSAVFLSRKIALSKWNTRPAPPIGRCGEWIPKEDESISKRNRLIRYKVYSCSICGRSNGRVRKKFCPNCGARMDGEENAVD